ncbi:MAG: SDR family NAD(P)-dependent oxidoreductase [Lysobacterales bacterium]
MEKRRALVTGGGTGIGLATARALIAAGHHVTISGRNEDALKHTGLPYIIMDVTCEASVTAGFAAVGDIDILVSNAGAANTAPLLKTSLSQWQDMLNVNLTGAFLCARAGLPSMVKRRWGRFIVVASTSSLKGYPYTGAYTAAKHGALGLVRTLALEMAKTGVTANAVCPGFTNTELLTRSIATIVKTTGMDKDQALKALLKDNPMARAIEPEEVAQAIVWLASEHAGATNGQPIVLDGGELAGG